jgi:hypothetical protein
MRVYDGLIMLAPKKFRKWPPVLYLGLKLTIHAIKSQIHLVRQSIQGGGGKSRHRQHTGLRSPSTRVSSAPERILNL